MNPDTRSLLTARITPDATDCMGGGWSTTVFPRRLCQELARTSTSDVEDIHQDLGLEIWRRAPSYNPDRGPFEAYASVVARSRAKNLRAARHAGIRDWRRTTFFCNELSALESSKLKVDQVSDDVYRSRLGSQPHPACDRRDLAIDLRRALSKLPRRLRSVAETLAVHTKADAARKLGIARSTLYLLIKEIRQRFEADGLDAYLNLGEEKA